jgi:hypothetical protein
MKTVFEHCIGEHLTLERANEWMSSNEEKLAPHVVRRPDLKPVCPGLYFPRECFPRAEQWLMANPQHNAVYVFGEAVCGGWQQHGWVEIDDAIVFDGVMQNFYNKKGYYQSELARPWYRYTRDAVIFLRRLMRQKHGRFNHYLWHSILDLPWAKSAQDPTIEPLLVDGKMARTCFPKKGRG